MFYGVVREKVNSCVCGGWFSVYVIFETCNKMHGQQIKKFCILYISDYLNSVNHLNTEIRASGCSLYLTENNVFLLEGPCTIDESSVYAEELIRNK